MNKLKRRAESFCAFLFLPLFLLSVSLLLSQENKVIVKAEKASIYSNPGIISSIIETVEKGAVLTLVSPEKMLNKWYKVSFYSKKKSATISGFIQASLVGIWYEAPKIAEKERPEPKIEERKPIVAQFTAPKVHVPKKIRIGPKFGFIFHARYEMPLEDKYSRGLQYGGNLCLGVIKNISIELGGLRFQSNVEGDPEGLSKGKLSMMPIELSLQARFPISGRFVPYLLGGGDYYLNRFALDKEIIDAWSALGFDMEEKMDNFIGYHIGAGIDLFFTENIALNFDCRYCIAKTKGSWILTDQISGAQASGSLENLNLNSLMFGGGLKFCF
jgi:outer membrane protein W